MNCKACGRKMRPLFSSYFCPNDCDRRPPKKTAETEGPHTD